MKKLNRAMALAGALLFFLAAVALTAPLHGCARTGRAIGNLISAVGNDFASTVDKLAGPDKPQAVAAKEAP